MPGLRFPLISALLAFSLGACSLNTYRLGAPLQVADTPDAAAALDVGDVLRQLGPPHRLSSTVDGYVMAWESWTIRERSVGFSLGFVGARFLNVDWGNASTRGTFLLANFDRNHQLRDATFATWDSDAGGGQGLQPLASIVPVVDVADLLGPMPQHRWGVQALERLPAGLNRQSAPGNGANGIEQRGTSTAVGQHSLDTER